MTGIILLIKPSFMVSTLSQRSSGESIVVSSLFSLSLSFIIRLSRSNNMNWKEGPPEPETGFLLASSTTTATNNNNNPHRHGHDDEESPGAMQGLEDNQDEYEAPTSTPSSTPQQPHEEPEEDPSSSSDCVWCCDDRILLIVMNLMNLLDGLIPVVSVLVGKNKDTTTNEDNNDNLLDDHQYVNPIVMDLVKVRHKNQRTNSPVSSQPLVLTFDALLLSMRSFCCCPIAQQVVVALLGLVGVLQFHPTCGVHLLSRRGSLLDLGSRQ